MRLWKSSLAVAIALSISGCNDGSSNSGSSSSSLKLPGSIGLIQPGGANVQASAQSGQASVQGGQAQVSAFSEAGTEYSNFSPESIQVDIEGNQPIEFINSVLCFVGQVVPQDNVDTGKYVSMVEEGQCFGGPTTYQRVTTEITTSGSSFELNLFWDDDSQNADSRVRIVVEEGVRSTAPFGIFDMYMRTIPTGGGTETKIHLSADRSSTDQAELVITMDVAAGVDMQSYASVNSGRTAGFSFTKLSTGNDTSNFRMAFEGQFIESIDSATNTPQCLDKNIITEDVYGYALFYKASGTKSNGDVYAAGDEVEVNPGIGFTYDNDSKRGFISDWGHWTEEPLTDGTISITSDNSDSTPYKLVVTTTDSIQTAVLKNDAGTQDITFGGEVDFGTASLVASDSRSGTGDYSGPLSYYGQGTMGIFGSSIIPPNTTLPIAFSMADGTELTSDGITYVVKAVDIVQQLGSVVDGNCDDLDPQDQSENLVDIDDLDSDLFPSTEFTAATTDPKYINGELQDN